MSGSTNRQEACAEAWGRFTGEEGPGPDYEYADWTSFQGGWERALAWAASFFRPAYHDRCQRPVATRGQVGPRHEQVFHSCRNRAVEGTPFCKRHTA